VHGVPAVAAADAISVAFTCTVVAVIWGWFGWVIARCAAVRPWRWWWFGGAPAVGLGVVRQRSFVRLPCTRPILGTRGGRRRSERRTVDTF
jgi:hypothetical protein